MDLSLLIGFDEEEAREELRRLGFTDISTIINDKPSDKCNRNLVCQIRQSGDHITLVCSRFYIF